MGSHCFDAEAPTTIPESCPDVVGAGHPAEGDFVEGLGLTVVGGHVYRGAAVPQLRGRYVSGLGHSLRGLVALDAVLASPGRWQGPCGCLRVGGDGLRTAAKGGSMSNAERIDAERARERVQSGEALLVCAYDDEEKCRKLGLDEALTLAELQARDLPRDREIVFLCA